MVNLKISMTLLLLFSTIIGVNFPLYPLSSSEVQILTQSQTDGVEAFLKEASEKFDQGESESALKIYQQVLQIYQQQNNLAGEAATLNKIGQTYADLLDDAKALDYFEAALPVYKQIKDRAGETEVLTKIGASYQYLNNHSQALEFLVQARIIQEEGNTNSLVNQRLLATQPDTLFELGRVYFFLGKYPLALAAYEKSLEIRSQSNNLFEDTFNQQLRIGVTQLLIGAVYFSKNLNDSRASQYFQLSQTTFEKVLSEYRKVGNKFEIAKTLSNLGNAYNLGRKHSQALTSLQESLAIFQEFGYDFRVADVLKSIGRVYVFQGAFQKQLDLEKEALAIYQKFGDLAMIGKSLSDIANIYSTWFSQHQAALEFYQEALVTYQKLDDLDNGALYNNQENLAATKLQIGTMYFNLGDYQKTLDFYQQSLEIYQELSKSQSATSLYQNKLAQTLQKMGNTYLNIGKIAEAKQFMESALVISREIKDPLLESGILSNLSQVSVKLGQIEEAKELLKQSSQLNDQIFEKLTPSNIDTKNLLAGLFQTTESQLSFTRQIGNRALEALILGNIAGDYEKSGEYDQAFDYYQQSRKVYQDLGDRSNVASNFTSTAILHYKLKQYPQALDNYQKSLGIYQEIQAEPEQASILSLIGETLFITGKFVEAEKQLFNAINIWESLREGLADQDKISLFDIRAQSYKFLQKTLIAQNKTETALEISERGRARAFVDLLISRTSSNLINESELPLPINLTQIQQIAQQQNATIIEYSLVSNQEIYIWVINPQGEIKFRSQPIENNSLNLSQLVTTTRKSLGVRGRGLEVSFAPLPDSKSNLKQLYQLLIEPIAYLLPTDPQQKLIFIPQNNLFSVPFPALVDKDDKYLIEKYTILIAPSIQVLQLTHEKRQAVSGKDILVVGNPTMPNITTQIDKPPEQLSSLPGAETEALEIAQILKTKPLIGTAATKKTIVQQLANARIIHFATHGLLEYGIPEESGVKDIPGAIALAPSGNDNGLLTSREIFNLKLNAELVVLSACDTGRGDITGDGVIGLSRSFVTAGVPSVIVSLWAVPDAPTAELMTEFYQQWEKSGNKAEALRQAMLITMESHQHPRDWAAFTLIGEGE